MSPGINEETVRTLVEDGRLDQAIETIFAAHGAAFYGYISQLVRNDELAAEAFQLFSLRLWQALASFRWESKLLTWAYTIARNSAYRTLKDPYLQRCKRLDTVEQEALAAKWTRTCTTIWRQTTAKSRLWESIDSLPPGDRELLLLRLGRSMSWLDIATVLLGEHTEPGALRREAASARKRFERLKTRLMDTLDTRKGEND